MMVAKCDSCAKALETGEKILYVDVTELSFLVGRRSPRVHDDRGERCATMHICEKCSLGETMTCNFGELARRAIDRGNPDTDYVKR